MGCETETLEQVNYQPQDTAIKTGQKIDVLLPNLVAVASGEAVERLRLKRAPRLPADLRRGYPELHGVAPCYAPM